MCAKGTQVWKDVGIELLGGGNDDALDVIENDNSDMTNCCSKMFRLWLERQPTASYRQLIQVLEKVKLNYLADQVKSKLKTPVTKPRVELMGIAGLLPTYITNRVVE